MTIAWPAGVNLAALTGSLGEKLDKNTADFDPGVGPQSSRRRMSIKTKATSFSTRMTFAEYATFLNWYKNTIADGTLPFYRTHPRSGTVETFTFIDDAPRARDMGNNLMEVQMVMRNVPGSGASWLPLLSNADMTKVPTAFTDFTTEGSSDPHYWYNGDKYASFSKWVAALGGTFVRAGATARYFKSGILQSPVGVSVPRFPTDANGAPTGLRCTSNETELCLWNRDLTSTGAVWGVLNMSAAKTQTGIDGVANSATLITATAANATIAQAITASSTSYNLGVWLKRITGTGTIQISIDNGATRTTIVPTATWTFFPISAVQTLANPTPKIFVATSGDAIAVDFVTVRAASTPMADPIATTTATVFKGADVLSFPYTSSTFSVLAKTINIINLTGLFNRIISFNDPNESGMFANFTPKAFSWYNATTTQVGPTIADFMALHKSMAAGSGSSSTGLITTDGGTPVLFNAPWNPVFHNKMFIGTDNAGNGAMDGDMQQFAYWDGVVASSADLKRLTT